MDPRDPKALLIAALCDIEKRDGCWLVPSQTTAGKFYRVTIKGDGSCTCKDFVEDHNCCKHIRAVRIMIRRELGMDDIVEEMRKVAKKVTEKKEYDTNRDHAAFNAAQAVEKHRVQEMLHELCSRVPEIEHKKRGRKPHSIKDAIFAMAMKVYGTLSARRTQCDLLDAYQRGFMSAPISGMKVCAFFENAAYTDTIKAMIAASAQPLRVVETKFAVDATGFPNTKSENWIDYNKGLTRRRTVWTKAHIACGVKTNVVAAVRISKQHESKEFEALIKQVASGFCVEEVYADKAYLEGKIVDQVFELGATPFIPPKSNTTGGIGGMFEKMVRYFEYKEEEFLKHYHLRSNVETAFSMVKAKIGEYVRSKTETAMVNEVLCKFLVHNLCVLNQEQHELGIEVEFWGKQPEQVAEPAPAA